MTMQLYSVQKSLAASFEYDVSAEDSHVMMSTAPQRVLWVRCRNGHGHKLNPCTMHAPNTPASRSNLH
jgi:hypothetical protein